MVAYVFKKTQIESDKLPPTFSALKYTIHRSYYMTYIWKSAISTNPILPDPENFGWKKIDDEYEPFMTDKTSCSSVGDQVYYAFMQENKLRFFTL